MNDSDQTLLEGEDIILISNQMLEDRYWTSKQYITQELKKKNRVLYVEANYSFGKLILGILKRTWPVKPFGALESRGDNLWVLTPCPRLPLRNHFRLFSYLNQLLLRFKVKRAAKSLGFQAPILWTFLHQTADLVSKLGEKMSIYHCVDDWPALLPMAGMGTPQQIIKDEDSLLNKATLIFKVSAHLLKDRETGSTPIVEVPNGVDTNLFRLLDNVEKMELPDLTGLQRPIIGFSGSIGPWVDTDLIRKVAREYPQSSIVLIGLNEKNPRLENLLREKNIHFLGMKKREEVPHYLSSFDVCLMPFDKGQVGEGLLPLKMFEYLAVGKPIVTITSQSMEKFAEVLFGAIDDESFVQQVGNAIKNGDKNELVIARRQVAQEYSWGNRVQQYTRHINNIKMHEIG